MKNARCEICECTNDLRPCAPSLDIPVLWFCAEHLRDHQEATGHRNLDPAPKG